jgi:hypothetical protein
MITTDKTIASVPLIFKDGTHKWGGIIYGANPYNAAGMYTGRVALGCVKRQNDYVVLESKSYTVGDETVVVAAEGESNRYLVNDWTLPNFIGAARQNNVTYYRTRKQAMAKIAAIAAALVGTTAR